MLEPCAVKVASTVLRRGLHREMGFLSDNYLKLIDYIKLLETLATLQFPPQKFLKCKSNIIEFLIIVFGYVRIKG